MSARCQIRVSAKQLIFQEDGAEEVWLYHHCDGYPTHMLPELLKAYKEAIAPKVYTGGIKLEKAWEAGRPGKAAAYMIAADPGAFEPQSKQDQDFHGDIEWFYEVMCTNPNGGASGPKIPKWEVQIYTTLPGFWDSPKKSLLNLQAQGDIVALAKKAKSIELCRVLRLALIPSQR